jgi:hypothetical protein
MMIIVAYLWQGDLNQSTYKPSQAKPSNSKKYRYRFKHAVNGAQLACRAAGVISDDSLIKMQIELESTPERVETKPVLGEGEASSSAAPAHSPKRGSGPAFKQKGKAVAAMSSPSPAKSKAAAASPQQAKPPAASFRFMASPVADALIGMTGGRPSTIEITYIKTFIWTSKT